MAYISNLPLLFANGQPTSLNAMSLVDLQYFIPFLMKCTTGQDPKYWGTLQKPNWWPTDVPFSQKIIYPSLAISDINQVWTSRFRVLVYNCYIYYGCKYLLDFSAHLRDCDREGVTYQRNNDGTISAFDRTEGKLLVNFRDVNRDYDLAYRQTPTMLIGTLPGMPTQLLTPSSFISPHLQRRIVTASIPPSGSVPEIQSVPHLQPSSQSRLVQPKPPAPMQGHKGNVPIRPGPGTSSSSLNAYEHIQILSNHPDLAIKPVTSKRTILPATTSSTSNAQWNTEQKKVPSLQVLEQRKVNGKLPSELPSSLFNALSTSLEEVKKWADDNIRLMKDFEGEEPMEFLSEALTRTRNAVKKLKDVNMKLLKAPKRRADSIDIGQRKESFFSKSTADVGKETASTSDETSSDVQTPQLVESGPSKSSSQSSLQELKTGVSKGGKAPATSNRTLAVGMQNKEEPRSEPLILSENISTAARRNANAKNTTALLIREVPNDGTHVDEKLASKAKDRVNSSDPGLNVTAEVGKSTPQSSCSIPEEQNEPAPSLENRSSGVQTRQLAESGLSKPSSQRSRQKLKTKVSKGIDQGKRYECEICPETFNYSWSLTMHQRSHTGEKPFECPTCKKKFSSSSNLSTHVLTHTGEKLYECSVCKKKYTRNSTLTVHQKVHENDTQ